MPSPDQTPCCKGVIRRVFFCTRHRVRLYKCAQTRLPSSCCFERSRFGWLGPSFARTFAPAFHSGVRALCNLVPLALTCRLVQARDVDESRYMYDQLAILSPVMLALTAATPVLKGRLVDTDVRWNTIALSVDDRTPAERGLHEDDPVGASCCQIVFFFGGGVSVFFLPLETRVAPCDNLGRTRKSRRKLAVSIFTMRCVQSLTLPVNDVLRHCRSETYLVWCWYVGVDTRMSTSRLGIKRFCTAVFQSIYVCLHTSYWYLVWCAATCRCARYSFYGKVPN